LQTRSSYLNLSDLVVSNLGKLRIISAAAVLAQHPCTMSTRIAQIREHLSPSSNLILTSHSADGKVITLTINNAARANCLSTPVLEALLQALRSINPEITLDSSVDREDPILFAERVVRSHGHHTVPKVVILKAAGNIFSSGHDLREFHNTSCGFKAFHKIFDLCNSVMLTIRRLPQVVISQVKIGVPC
jgi:hypothetical protein